MRFVLFAFFLRNKKRHLDLTVLCTDYFQIAFNYKTNKIETVYKSLLVEISSEKYTTLVPYTHTQKNNLKIMSELKKIPLKKLKI